MPPRESAIPHISRTPPMAILRTVKIGRRTGHHLQGKEDPPHIESFYHLSSEKTADRHCQGTACFVAQHLNPDRWSAAVSQEPRTYCLGSCFAAPASSSELARPPMKIRSRGPIVLGPIVDG